MNREPDLEIRAGARATELRFECKPNVRVVVYADSPAYADSGSERDNLPEHVEPGVTYQNIAVRWWAAARLDDSELPF